MESVSLNLDLDNNEEEEDVEDRQKEIQGLLSTAFDDLSSLSEDEEEYNGFKKLAVNGVNGDNEGQYERNYPNQWPKHVNGLTSTPRLHSLSNNDSKKNFWTKSNGKHFNVSDILEDEEEEEYDGENDDSDGGDQCNGNRRQMSVNGINHKTDERLDSKNSSLENGRTEQSVHSLPPKQRLGSNERSFSQSHVQLLIEENQRLSNELIVSQQRLSAINGNYEGLEYRLKELDSINVEKENQLVRLEAKIRSLEVNIKVEKEAKEEFQRKLCVCESTIESLQYQLMEIGKSDCMVRAQDMHDSVVQSLKLKHENELILLKGEIEGLGHELNAKNSEIIGLNRKLSEMKAQNNENNFNNQLKDMIKATKELWEQEMKERVENDIKSVLEFQEKKWTKSAEQELRNERNKWEQELQTEILEIIEFLKIKFKLSAGTLPEKISLRFVPLLNLWHALENSCDSKEQALRVQTEKLKEAKLQLEEALNESRLNRTASPSNGPSNDQILSELKKVSEEAILTNKKLHKYKQHYHQLIRRHKQEIERIKEEFAHILEALKRDLK